MLKGKYMLERASRSRLVIGLVSLTFLAGAFLAYIGTAQAADEAGIPEFQRTWERTDKPVKEGKVARTWMWGPEAFTDVMSESYVESPGGMRQVQYFDKSRMEINDPNAPDDGLWYVTNGLLVVEMISGELQVGDDSFEAREPSMVNVAGDPDDPTGPTYSSFATHLASAGDRTGQTVTQRLTRNGEIVEDAALADQSVTLAFYDDVTGHNVAQPFWDFMNSQGLVYQNGEYVQDQLFQNPFYATGRPITEPYFADVKVAGTVTTVLMQCFERRCLTYTPRNEPGFQVEAGNVGLHYFCWRYGYLPEGKGDCIGSPVTPPPGVGDDDGSGDGDGDGGSGDGGGGDVPGDPTPPGDDDDGGDNNPTPPGDDGDDDPTPPDVSGTGPSVDVNLDLGMINISALGGSYTVPVEVTNTGTQTDDIVVQLTKDGLISTCGPDSQSRTITLSKGESTTVNFSQTCGLLSLDLVVDYTATATINRAPGATDTDSDNLLLNIGLLPGDDDDGGENKTLDVLPLNYSAIDVGIGESFNLPVRVKNNGDTTLSNVSISLSNSGLTLCPFSESTTRTIAPGQTVTVNFNQSCLVTLDLLTEYTATATSGTLSDTESDSVVLKVSLLGGGDDDGGGDGDTPPGGGELTLDVLPLNYGPIDVGLGQPFTLPVRVTNNGDSTLSNVSISLSTSGITTCPLNEAETRSIDPGQTVTVNFTQSCLLTLNLTATYTATATSGTLTDSESDQVLLEVGLLGNAPGGFLEAAA